MFLKFFKLFIAFTTISILLINCDNRPEANDKVSQDVAFKNMKEADDLEKIIALYNQYIGDADNKDKLLLSMGQIAMKMKISIEEFNKKKDYKNICHLRIVRSANFGYFVSYDGYHFEKILNDYPNSEFAADAEYSLIYIVPDEYNYKNLDDEKNKLELFLKKYPESNLKNNAKKRYDWIVDYLKNGGQSIVD
jgi:hypothetical protein